MDNRTNIRTAGQVIIDKCEIIRDTGDLIDLQAMVESIVIYEDIFAPYITGKLMIRDTQDIPTRLGRSGADMLHLVITTPSLEEKRINSLFVIYKMSDRADITHRSQLYSLWFCPPEMLIDCQTHLSSAFSGSGNDIIESTLVKYYGKSRPFNFDKTSNSIKYISNFWSITKNFAYIAEHSLGPLKTPTYLFYENRDGFNFKEIAGLASKDIPIFHVFTSTDLVANVETEGIGKGNVTNNLEAEFSKILTNRVDKTFDFLDDYLNGAVKTKLYSNDVITKRIRTSMFMLSDSGVPTLNESPIYNSELIDVTTPMIMVKDRGYGTFGPVESSNYKFIQHRIAYMRSLRSSVIEIDVFGRTDFTVGKKVMVESNLLRELLQQDSYKDKLDKLYSGVYIITALSHQITKMEHKCTIELCKESTLLK
jgi:hypothetical protein